MNIGEETAPIEVPVPLMPGTPVPEEVPVPEPDLEPATPELEPARTGAGEQS